MIAYVLETIVCSALFLALYRLLIAGKVAPLPSRIFLAGTMILSEVIPALNLPILPAKAQYVQIPVTAAAKPHHLQPRSQRCRRMPEAAGRCQSDAKPKWSRGGYSEGCLDVKRLLNTYRQVDRRQKGLWGHLD